MPKQKYGDTISQHEAKVIRFHLEHTLHIVIPPNWTAWNKTATKLSDEVSQLSGGDITLEPTEIEMIAGRVAMA